MRFKLIFELENDTIPLQYRKSIVSWIKQSLQNYDEKLYLELYKDRNVVKKPFSFSPILTKPKFDRSYIKVDNNIIQIIFSFYNYAYALHFYNSFLKQKNKKFSIDKNSMTLKGIYILPEKNILTNSINVKMLSPLVSRFHSYETLKDYYYSYINLKEFKKYLKINIIDNMKQEGLDTALISNFDIQPIDAKKTVIPIYEQQIEVSLGTFRIQGNPELLNYIYKARNAEHEKD